MKHLPLLLICGGMLCSCSITKRHFGSGYHIEWKRKIALSDPDKEIANPEPIENSQLTTKQPEADSLVMIEPVAIETKADEIPPEETSAEVPQTRFVIRTDEVQKKEKVTESNPKRLEDEEAPKRRMPPLMWGIWGMWSIAIACMFFVTFYAEFLIGVALGFFIAMIFALIVLRSLRKNPVQQPIKGLVYGFGIPAIVFGVIASAGLGLILVILLI